MTTRRAVSEERSSTGHIPPAMHPFSSELSPWGHPYLEKIGLAIDEMAPKPGLLVYLAARTLAMPMNGLDAVLFSAVDVSTHLQVAQAYHSLTTASAVSFVDFAAESFPFPISQIRTLAERPFHHGLKQASQRDFSVLIGRQGYIHSPITDPGRDALLAITSKLLFGGVSGSCLMHATSHDLQKELGQFLFFHNNYRSIPWLGGKTPLQRLKMFDGFSSIHAFSVYDELEQEPMARITESIRRTGRARVAVGA